MQLLRTAAGHRILNADLVIDGVSALFDSPDDRADLVWTDPPWGNMKFWDTLDRKKGGRGVSSSWFDFLAALLPLLRDRSRGPVLIEMGRKQRDDLEMAVALCGGWVREVWGTTYAGDRPSIVFDVAFPGRDLPNLVAPRGEPRGWSLAHELVRSMATPGGVLFDPCLGLGGALKLARAAGMRCYGSEVNRDRFERSCKLALSWDR